MWYCSTRAPFSDANLSIEAMAPKLEAGEEHFAIAFTVPVAAPDRTGVEELAAPCAEPVGRVLLDCCASAALKAKRSTEPPIQIALCSLLMDRSSLN